MSDKYDHDINDLGEIATELRDGSEEFVHSAVRDRRKFIGQVSLFVLIIIAIVVAYLSIDFETLDPDGMRAWVASFGIWSSLVFFVTNVVFTVLLLPGSFFSFSAGALFGFWWGFILVLVGETIGSSVAFILGRYFGNMLKRRIRVPQSTPVKKLNHYIDKHGIITVIFLRVVPIVPYILFNYLAGATRLRFLDYLIGTFIGLSVWISVYVYLGDRLVYIDTRWLWVIWLFVVCYALGNVIYQRIKSKGDKFEIRSAKPCRQAGKSETNSK